jgi:hypothetical protein
MSTYCSDSNESSAGSTRGSVRGGNGVISTVSSREDEEYGDVASVKKMEPVNAAYGDDEQEQEQEQMSKVNSLFMDFSCCCFPTMVAGPKEVPGRVSKWFLGNSDQLISSIIGE